VANPGGKEKDRGLIIITGNVGSAKVKQALEGNTAIKSHVTPLGEGAKHAIYEMAAPGQEMAMFLAIVGEKTVVVSPGKDYVVDALKASRAKKKPTLKDKNVQAMIERFDEKQSVSLIVQASNCPKRSPTCCRSRACWTRWASSAAA
jgi:hypothetical protein